jgi:putative membrane protein
MLTPVLKKNDKQARLFIITVSFVVFVAITMLTQVKLDVDLGFDVHLFAGINATINSAVSVLLILALVAVKRKNYVLHKKIMLTTIVLSVLFLISYVAHHLFAGETRLGDINHDGIVDAAEKAAVGSGLRTFYYIILPTHIILAGVILPFILFTAYRALTGEYTRHAKLARFTWPIWLYVSITGVLIYLLISPYYP